MDGGAGTGKTRLLTEAAATAVRLGVRAGCGAADCAVPMGAFLAALHDGASPLARRGLRPLPEERYARLDEVGSRLERIARRWPVLVGLDDMQWADPDSLTALRTLPARLDGLPIVWLVALRGGEAAPELRTALLALERAGARTLALPPLAPAAVAHIVADVAGAEPDPFLLALARRAHGNPFLLVELLRGLGEEGLVRTEAGRARLIEPRLPVRVRDGVRDRLARLSEPARQAAFVAGALDRHFTFDQLSAVLRLPAPALLGPIDELLRAELLAGDGGRLTFRHDLVREAVRHVLPASAWRALRREAIDALARTRNGAATAIQLAASAGAGDQVTARTLRQAARALAASDPAAAADLSRRALELSGANDPARTPLAAETALLLHAAGRGTEGRLFADHVLGEALPSEQEAEIRLSVAGMIGLSPEVRVEAGRRALALADLPPALRARHLARLVHNLLVAGRPREARALLPEARGAAAAAGDANAAFTLDLAEGGLAYVGGSLGRALERIEAALRSRARAQEPARELLAQEWRTEGLAALDRYDESLRLADEHAASARRSHQEWALRLWEGWRGRQLLQVGRLAEAAAALEVTMDGEAPARAGVLETAAIVALGRVAIHTGDEATLRRCLAVARAVVATGAPAVRRHGAWLLALHAMAGGDGAGARAHLAALGERARRTVVPLFPFDVTDEVHLVRIARAAGDAELVCSAVATAAGRLRRNPGVGSIAGAALHARGLATGDRAALAEAVERFTGGPRPLALASALEDAGRLALQCGERDEAVAAFGRALEVCAAAGATRDAARVRRRLRGLGVRRRLASATRSRSRSESGWAGLSPSELAVVRLVVQGMTNREAAARLFLSPHTVSTHLRHAFAKLDVSSRVGLAGLAARHDAVD